MRVWCAILLIFLCSLLSHTWLVASESQIVAAVITFDTSTIPDDKMGDLIGATLPSLLNSTEQRYSFVERGKLKAILLEQKLGQSGLVDTDSATKISALLSARILISGRAYYVGDEIWISAKIFSAESGKLESVLAKGPRAGNLSDVLKELAIKIGKKLTNFGDLSATNLEGRTEKLRILLKDKKLPVIGIALFGSPALQKAFPLSQVAQSEALLLLKHSGFHITTQVSDIQRHWLEEFVTKPVPVPDNSSRPSLLFAGVWSYELTGGDANQVHAEARIEITAVNFADGKLSKPAKATANAVDISDQNAVRSAIQDATGDAIINLLMDISKDWRPTDK